MKCGIVFVVMLLVSVWGVAAQSGVNDWNNYSSVDMHFSLLSNFSLVKQSSRARVDSVTAELLLYPLAEKQEVANVRFDAQPKATILPGADRVTYTWGFPTSEFFTYAEEADVRGVNLPLLVTQKVSYPLEPIVNEFTQETEFIDITPEIRERARVLAEGEDDLFVVAFKVASWVEKNIKYDLTTLTAPVVQKSSWVLQNREGVCDELTNLFISMMRSRGVPARFVTGVAYTNVGHRWGPHAWAEVFFPNVGWVPFDVTYGQFGWVDPSHIRLRVATDSGEPSVKYMWKSLDAKFKNGQIMLQTEARGTGAVVPQSASLAIRPLVNKVGPGSYVPVEVHVRNLKQAYLPLTLTITKAQQLTERNVRHLVLKPGEDQRIYWVMQVPAKLDAGFNYYASLEVQDQFHYAARSNVTYGATYQVYSAEDAAKIVEGQTVESTYSRFVDIDCVYREYAFSYEKVPVTCAVRNNGEFPLYDAKVCVAGTCTMVTIPEKEEKSVHVELPDQSLGVHAYEVLVENKDVRKIEKFFVTVLRNPDMVVTGVQIPERVAYQDEFQASFVMNVKAPVQDVTAYVNGQRVITIPELVQSKKLIVKALGSEYVGTKMMNVTITYKDHNGKEYGSSQAYPITVTNIPFVVRLLLWLRVW